MFFEKTTSESSFHFAFRTGWYWGIQCHFLTSDFCGAYNIAGVAIQTSDLFVSNRRWQLQTARVVLEIQPEWWARVLAAQSSHPHILGLAAVTLTGWAVHFSALCVFEGTQKKFRCPAALLNEVGKREEQLTGAPTQCQALCWERAPGTVLRAQGGHSEFAEVTPCHMSSRCWVPGLSTSGRGSWDTDSRSFHQLRALGCELADQGRMLLSFLHSEGHVVFYFTISEAGMSWGCWHLHF